MKQANIAKFHQFVPPIFITNVFSVLKNKTILFCFFSLPVEKEIITNEFKKQMLQFM
jgi:hypothetical protein